MCFVPLAPLRKRRLLGGRIPHSWEADLRESALRFLANLAISQAPPVRHGAEQAHPYLFVLAVERWVRGTGVGISCDGSRVRRLRVRRLRAR